MPRKKKDKNLKYSILITICFILAAAGIYTIKNLGYSKDVILQKASNYYINEQYFMAAKYYDKAIQLKASGSDIFRNYGIVLTKLGNYDNSIRYLKMASEIDPYSPEIFYFLGNAYYQKALLTNNSEKFLQAVESLEKAINLSPETEKYYLLIGLSYRSCGMQENARAWYRRAMLVGNVSRAGFYNLIGHTFREEERYMEAASYYSRAIAEDVNFAAAYCNLGDMYAKVNDDETALLNYEKAIGVNADFIVPYIKIGSLYTEQGRYAESIQWYLRALNINPDDDKANYLLGITYKEMGRKNEAVERFKKAAYCGSDDAVYELRNIGIELR